MRARLTEFRRRLHDEEAARGRLVPQWAVPLLVVCAVGLIPWTVVLALSLPRRHEAHHWALAWAMFDVAIASSLAATAYTVIKRPSLAEVFASVGGTLLLVDAWFDVSTSASGNELATAVAMAVFAEIPLAVLCFTIARDIERVTSQAGSYLRAAGFKVEHGRLVPPLDPGQPGAEVRINEEKRAESNA
jgi:hypothetical protein